MISTILNRKTAFRFLSALALSVTILVQSGVCQDAEDSQIFISGFNAYQQKDYNTAIRKMNDVLEKHPDTPLRDMTLFWLARAYFKSGNQQDAARYMSQFTKEYPENPLKGTVEEELLALAAAYDKKVGTSSVSSQAVSAEKQVQAQKASAAAAAEEVRAAAARQEQIAAAKAAEERVAAEKAAQLKLAAEAAEQKKLAAAKAEEERLKAEQARLAADKAEKARLAAVKAEQDRLAALKAEQERVAAEKAAQLKFAAEAAEQKKLAAAKAEEERLKAEQARLAADKAEKARLAAVKAEQDRLAALKAEQERVAAEKAAQLKLAAEAAEQKKLAAAKAEEERLKAEQARLAADKAEKARLAAVKAEQDRLAALKAEQERVAAEKSAQLKLAAEAAEQKKLAAAKAEEERLKAEQARLAADKAEKARLAAVKAEQDRLAALKAEQERVAAEKAVRLKLAAEAAEQKKIAAAKADEERLAQEKANQQRLAEITAELERQAAIEKEQKRMADAKAEEDRLAQEKAALQKRASEQAALIEQERLAAEKVKAQQLAQQRRSQEQSLAEKSLMREKAIAQYKSVIEKYPDTRSAALATVKLKELGVEVPAADKAQTSPLEQSGSVQVLKVEVAQFTNFDFSLLAAPGTYDVASPVSLPFQVTNRGNGTDSFYLESGFPVEYNVIFTAASTPDQAVNQTSSLAPGETFKGFVKLAIPATAIDGLRISYPVKAASRFMGETTQSREIRLTAAAPLLRSVLKSDKVELLPGDKIVYRIALLNLGSSTARNVTLRLDFPPQLEPMDHASAGFKQEMKAALVLDGLEVKSGENKEFALTFQLKDDALAGQELLARAELINHQLKTNAAFVSNVTSVKPLHKVKVTSGSEHLVVIPGETITVPFVVTNTGNIRDKFKITSAINGNLDATIFHDLNRDGIRQASEPVISSIGPLEPKEEARVAMEIRTLRTAGDGADGNAGIRFVSEGDPNSSVSASARLVYSRPVLQMVVNSRDGRLKPGEITTFEMNVTNRGSNLARVVELQSSWPSQLELVAAEPANSAAAAGNYVWKFSELGAGEKRTIKVSFRVKPGIGVGANLQVKNVMTYEDQLGNRY